MEDFILLIYGNKGEGLRLRFILAALFIHGVKEMMLLKQLLKVEKLQQQTQIPLCVD